MSTEKREARGRGRKARVPGVPAAAGRGRSRATANPVRARGTLTDAEPERHAQLLRRSR